MIDSELISIQDFYQGTEQRKMIEGVGTLPGSLDESLYRYR